MIKIIHCADVHLGSKIDSRLPADKVRIRRAEVLATFERMVGFAQKNGVKVIMLSGDVFDSDRPIKKDKDAFYHIVKSHPEIDFLYLRGNHDGGQIYEESADNLKTFVSTAWTTYSYGNVNICGIEMAYENARSLYSTLNLPADGLNIVMLHGQAGNADGMDKVNLLKLRKKNIDYLALGHIHEFSEGKLDERGSYAYSGCLEGRGFDEAGEKGFILITADEKISYEFVPFAKRKIVEITADVSGADELFEARDIACAEVYGSKQCTGDDLVRLNVVGEIPFDNQDLAGDILKKLEGDYFFVSVKDKTYRRFDVEKLALDKSLKGEFIRTVLADESIPPELKSRVVSVGLKALAGREVE
ncbi:MAG: exonuclease SbcCD subunit D [Candidatus Coproplasma sp.]